MTIDLLLALIAFATVSSITPGPNNVMLMASGANFGFRRTIPHMFGIGVGFSIMIMLVGSGLVQIFDAVPVTYTVLKVVSVLYLVWLAYKIATAAAPQGRADAQGQPFTFMQAALFQWVNPKAWTMALSAITVYSPDRSLVAVAIVACTFGLVNFPSVSTWVLIGKQMARVLTSKSRLRAFNWTMAALLLGSLYPVLMG